MTLPMLSPSLFFVIVISFIGAFQIFDPVHIITQGGPGNATNILPLYSYQQAFSFNNLAYGALIGNIMVVIATVFGVFYVRITARRL